MVGPPRVEAPLMFDRQLAPKPAYHALMDVARNTPPDPTLSAPLEAAGPPMLMTGDQQLVKQMNRMALVRMLCREPALSRADLAVRLGLTKSTVGMLVRELVEEGWLSEAETVTTGGLGRRPTRCMWTTRAWRCWALMWAWTRPDWWPPR